MDALDPGVDMLHPVVHRMAAFTRTPEGGNPAGVVIADGPLDDAWMQATAADVGYSETAFLWPGDQPREWVVRYFSPIAEVPFCGHATIASGALLARQSGSATHRLETRTGTVLLDAISEDGRERAALTSVDPAVLVLPEGLVDAALATMGWGREVLHPAHAPALADAGARHLLLPLDTRERLAAWTYAFDDLRRLMLAHDLTTVALLWPQDEDTWHARNAFPVGGVVEDPATGAAAAAVGGWLRATAGAAAPAALTIHQGDDLGRPSVLDVVIPSTGGIVVAGDAVPIEA